MSRVVGALDAAEAALEVLADEVGGFGAEFSTCVLGGEDRVEEFEGLEGDGEPGQCV